MELFDPQKTRDWIDQERAAGRLTGGALEVRIGGDIALQTTFGTRRTDGEPITVGTKFWIASMTKPIVAIAALRLVEQGELSLDDPVSDYIPGFGAAGVLQADGSTVPVKRPPTLLDLFIHTSGITYGQFSDDPFRGIYQEAGVYDFTANNAQMADRFTRIPLMHQPGTVFEYGMSNDLLGRVIEVQTGLELESALRKLVLDALSMTDTGFDTDPAKVADFPDDAPMTSLAPNFTRSSSWQSGGSGLFSTLEDYTKFAQFLLGVGRSETLDLLKPETVRAMRANHLPKAVTYGKYTPELGITAPYPENGLGFGLGFAVRIEDNNAIPGGVGEFFWPGASGTNFWVDPKNDLAVVFMAHAPDHRAEHRIDLRKAVYAGLM